MSRFFDKIKNKFEHKKTLNQKLLRIISTVLVLIIAAIVIATYKGLDFVYLAYAAIDCFFASYEVEDAYNEILKRLLGEDISAKIEAELDCHISSLMKQIKDYENSK